MQKLPGAALLSFLFACGGGKYEGPLNEIRSERDSLEDAFSASASALRETESALYALELKALEEELDSMKALAEKSSGGHENSRTRIREAEDKLYERKLSLLKDLRKRIEKKQSGLTAWISEVGKEIAVLDTTIDIRIPLVTTAVVQADTFIHYFEVQGVAEAEKSVIINTEAGGKVTGISAPEGTVVTQGQVILTLDHAVISGSIAELQKQYDLAKDVYERQEKLWKQNIGSEMQYLQAKSNMERLAQAMATMSEQAAKAVVRAPFSGVVDEIFVKQGELAMPGFPLVRLVNASDAYLVADISEKYVPTVKEGNAAIVSFPMISEKWYDASVRTAGSFINPDNRTFRARVVPKNLDFTLRPNLLCVVRIRDFLQDSAFAVSSAAIMQDAEGRSYLFRVDSNNLAEKVIVETGLSYQGMTHIRAGVGAGDRIVLEGARNIKDGDLLEIRR